MRNPIIYSLFALLLFSCSSDADLSRLPNEQKLSLYGLISPDSLICIRLSATTSITETVFPIIENARIQLYENDVWIGMFTYLSGWEYAIDYRPKAGQTYTIVAEADGFPSIKAVETLPANIEAIDVSSMTYQYPVLTLEPYVLGTAEFDLRDDSEHTVNYYEIIPESNCFSVSNAAVSVDTYRDYPVPMHSILFDNRTFAGKSIHFSIYATSSSSSYRDPYLISMKIRKVSPAYYAYKNSWYQHQYSQGFNSGILENLFDASSPIKMFSNIENGYGIFASYSEIIRAY